MCMGPRGGGGGCAWVLEGCGVCMGPRGGGGGGGVHGFLGGGGGGGGVRAWS